jgi:hypothetical protein
MRPAQRNETFSSSIIFQDSDGKGTISISSPHAPTLSPAFVANNNVHTLTISSLLTTD